MEDISHIILPGISYFIFLGATARLTTAEPPKASLSLFLSLTAPGVDRGEGGHPSNGTRRIAGRSATHTTTTRGSIHRGRRRHGHRQLPPPSSARRRDKGTQIRTKRRRGPPQTVAGARRDDGILGQSPVCTPACLSVSCALRRRGVKVEHARSSSRWIAAGAASRRSQSRAARGSRDLREGRSDAKGLWSRDRFTALDRLGYAHCSPS